MALYITDRARTLKTSTLERRLAALSQAHKAAGYPSPASTALEPLHSIWAGLRRNKGTVRVKKTPVLVEDLRAMIDALPREDGDDPASPLTLSALRDRAILVVGFVGAFRRIEVLSHNPNKLGLC